jgi:PKD repeat protein
MKKSIFLGLTSSLILLGSCTKTPNACVNLNSNEYNVGDTIHFENCTMDGSEYLWDFEDGHTSTEINPKHAYDSAGVYSVLLTAISKNGKKTHKLIIPLEIN